MNPELPPKPEVIPAAGGWPGLSILKIGFDFSEPHDAVGAPLFAEKPAFVFSASE
jgi:hypothetical protein